MVIRILQVAASADTGEQGLAVLSRIRSALDAQHKVVVSFDGITTATSSFVNAAFVELLSAIALSDIKSRLRVVDSTHQINDMIRNRMIYEGPAKPRAGY
jgi:hypothetical protein